jgi:hypothetical protein
VGRNLVNLYPGPNLPGIVNNFVYTPNQTTNANNFDVKMDQNSGPKDRAFFRYSQDHTQIFTPGSLPASGSTNAGLTTFRLHQFVASYTRTLSPRLINEARAGIERLCIETQQANFGNNVADQVGIPGVNGGSDPLRSGLPTVNVTGFQLLGDGGTRRPLVQVRRRGDAPALQPAAD